VSPHVPTVFENFWRPTLLLNSLAGNGAPVSNAMITNVVKVLAAAQCSKKWLGIQQHPIATP